MKRFGVLHTIEKNKVLPSWPSYAEDERVAALRVLESGKVNYWTGQEARDFEREYANYLGQATQLLWAMAPLRSNCQCVHGGLVQAMTSSLHRALSLRPLVVLFCLARDPSSLMSITIAET